MNLFSRIEGWFEQILFCSYSACMEERMLMISWIYLLSNLIISVWFAAPYGKFASSSQTPGIIIRFGDSFKGTVRVISSHPSGKDGLI